MIYNVINLKDRNYRENIFFDRKPKDLQLLVFLVEKQTRILPMFLNKNKVSNNLLRIFREKYAFI